MEPLKIEIPPLPPIPTEVSIPIDWDKVTHSIVYTDRGGIRHVELFYSELEVEQRMMVLIFDQSEAGCENKPVVRSLA